MLWWTAGVRAQSANSAFTLFQEAMIAGGGQVGSGNPMSALTRIGQPTGGGLTNGTFTLRADAPAPIPPLPPGARTIVVQGTVDDPTASVTVNGVPAGISGTTFQAAGIQIVEGANRFLVTATDPAGNTATASVTVYLATHPPARPTVAATAVTSTVPHTLTGTKTPGTSVWINGQQVVPLDDATTWSVAVWLLEGDNVFVITTRDAVGNESAHNTIVMVLDQLPPVLSSLAYRDPAGAALRPDPATGLSKTNLTPVTVAGQVDDHLTSVQISGLTAVRAGLTFEVAVPLAPGNNTLTLTATSPNGYVTTQTLNVIQGTIPTITTIQPTNGAKLYASATVTIQATATDPEQDPLTCQILLDGQVVVNWFAGASQPWTPGATDLGRHTLEIRAQDGFGGVASRQAAVYVLRQPVPPP
jgi:hypothetical protein